MSIKELEDNKIKTALIKVETLQKEYEVTLQQYQEAGQNYITSLQTTDPSNNVDFTSLKGRTWWGTSSLNKDTATSTDECTNMCLNLENCSGATYNESQNYCWMRSGNSSITTGRDTDYAIIPKQKAELEAMKSLNQKLLELIEEIQQEIQIINPKIEEQRDEINKKKKSLQNSHKQLLEQKIEMERQLNEYYSINQEEENKTLVVNQQNISVKMWSLITCLGLLVAVFYILGIITPFISFLSSIVLLIASIMLILFVKYKYKI